MMKLLIGAKLYRHGKLGQQLRMTSVNQLSVYHVAIQMFIIINNKSSESLLKYEPRGYGLRGLEEGKVRVTDKGKKEILQWFPLHEPKVVELSFKACQKNNYKNHL